MENKIKEIISKIKIKKKPKLTNNSKINKTEIHKIKKIKAKNKKKKKDSYFKSSNPSKKKIIKI